MNQKVEAAPLKLPLSSAAEGRVLGFWVFMAGEANLFAALLGTYMALRRQTAGGPGAQDLFSLEVVALATFVLLTSSFTGALATSSLRQGRIRPFQTWVLVTVALGEIFLFVQGYEFYEYLVHQGFSWQTSAFGSAFYSLVGFHGLHVIFGVFWLFGLWTQSFFWKEVTPEDLSRGWVAGLYWHFVDVVWVVIFTVVYLSGVVG